MEQKHQFVKSKLNLQSQTAAVTMSMSIHDQNKARAKAPVVCVKINDVSVEMLVDTGASTDILNEITYNKVNQSKSVNLQTPTKQLFAYGSKS